MWLAIFLGSYLSFHLSSRRSLAALDRLSPGALLCPSVALSGHLFFVLHSARLNSDSALCTNDILYTSGLGLLLETTTRARRPLTLFIQTPVVRFETLE